MDISHFSVRDIDSETEEADERERFIENLKTQFTFKHFWDYHPTQKILKSEHLQEFMNGAGRDINAFNSIEREFCKRHQASIFAFRDNTNGSLFESCIYNHIHKDYDIDKSSKQSSILFYYQGKLIFGDTKIRHIYRECSGIHNMA